MKILNRNIDISSKPFVIAEMSGNHCKSLSVALKIVEAAAKSGADAIKLQTFSLNSMTLNLKTKNFIISDNKSLWKGKKLYNLYNKVHTPWKWHSTIIKKAKKFGLICFSSVFDEESLDFLESLNAPAYKIASFENNHYPLIEKVAKTKKPLIISTGLASYKDLDEIYRILKKSKNLNFAFLKCTSSYPASPENTNLNTIPSLIKKYKCTVGLSDHTLGTSTAIASVSLGSRIIEKHIKLSKKSKSLDDKFSLDPYEFKKMTLGISTAWKSLGKNYLGLSNEENKSKFFKRSIYVTKRINKGEIFSKNNIKVIRPGNGLHPKFFNKLLGKKSKKDLKKGTPTRKNIF